MDHRPAAPLRIGLEPGYDAGRIGVWLLDVPGAFGWSASRERALSQTPSIAGGHRDWLLEHGETLDLPPLRGVDIVEEVPPTTLDGYERNATFEADRRPVTTAELERAVRWLAYARDDLLKVADRVAAYEANHGPLPAEGDRTERASDEVLRHLAGAEVWLTSRVDASLRFDGPSRDGEPRRYLDATRAWMLAQLPLLVARDPAVARTDGKGETWTLAKVVRRLVYHSLDHLHELERRLARADGTAERLVVTLDRRPTLAELTRLILAVGWDPRAAHPDRLEASTAASTEVVTAWDGERLVGHARSLTDGAMSAYISMVIVHPRYQALGVGRRLMRQLLDGHDGVRFALSSAIGMGDWYARLGFEPDERAMVRRRREDLSRR
jgi:ribosomal protein S18 acetylase RimI-like enzyme